jgi:hypothetical protein
MRLNNASGWDNITTLIFRKTYLAAVNFLLQFWLSFHNKVSEALLGQTVKFDYLISLTI